MTRALTFFVTVVALVLTLGACGPEPAPTTPTFEADVRPIMMSRCVRCHGAGGHLNADPHAALTYPPPDGYFNVYETADELAGPCPPPTGPDCTYGAKKWSGLMKIYIQPDAPLRMPPAPSPELDDRQREIITRWADEPTPLP
jgi:hypothetical protein